MRITSIELAGSSKTILSNGQPGLPRAFAKVARTAVSDCFEVTILRPGGERKHMIRADCEEDIRSVAECLQNQLDGYDGTNSEIEEYVRVLQYFAD